MNISVLVPHKNTPRKLARLLESIPQSVDVFVVDDDSDPRFLAEVRSVVSRFSNVALYSNPFVDKNAGTARNYAIDRCPTSTEWVIFADADDKFDTDSFDRLIEFLGSDSSSDAVFFGCNALNEDRRIVSNRCDRYRELISQWPDIGLQIATCWSVPWGRALRYRLLEMNDELRFSSRSAGNDIEFSAKLAATKPEVSVVREDVYTCYESNSSLTATLTPVKALDRLKATIASNDIYISNSLPKPHYEYGFTYFCTALPLILDKTEFPIVFDFLRNSFRAFLANLVARKSRPSTRNIG